MKLYRAIIEARSGPTHFTRTPFVIAEDAEEALGKISRHTQTSPRLRNAKIIRVAVTEEAVVD